MGVNQSPSGAEVSISTEVARVERRRSRRLRSMNALSWTRCLRLMTMVLPSFEGFRVHTECYQPLTRVLYPQRQGDEDGAPIHRQPSWFDRSPSLILSHRMPVCCQGLPLGVCHTC